MRSIHLPLIAQVRFLAGSLGEWVGWWPTEFTRAAAAARTLEILFPHTATRAALESVTEAARRVHDDIPGPRLVHLFRLPIHLEDRLAGWLAKPGCNLAPPPSGRDAILAELDRIGSDVASTVEGPICLGKPVRLNQEGAFRELAAIYAAAARRGIRMLPYFEE